jgi:hypothetical protein
MEQQVYATDHAGAQRIAERLRKSGYQSAKRQRGEDTRLTCGASAVLFARQRDGSVQVSFEGPTLGSVAPALRIISNTPLGNGASMGSLLRSLHAEPIQQAPSNMVRFAVDLDALPELAQYLRSCGATPDELVAKSRHYDPSQFESLQLFGCAIRLQRQDFRARTLVTLEATGNATAAASVWRILRAHPVIERGVVVDR